MCTVFVAESVGMIAVSVIAEPKESGDLADQRHPRVGAVAEVLEGRHGQLRQRIDELVLRDADLFQRARHLRPIEQIFYPLEKSMAALFRLVATEQYQPQLHILLGRDVGGLPRTITGVAEEIAAMRFDRGAQHLVMD